MLASASKAACRNELLGNVTRGLVRGAVRSGCDRDSRQFLTIYFVGLGTTLEVMGARPKMAGFSNRKVSGTEEGLQGAGPKRYLV